MMNGLKIAAAILACTIATGAQAATLDLTTATNDGTTLVAVGGTITAGAGTTLQVGDFVANAVCPLGGDGCNGLMSLLFDTDVSNVTFDYGFGGPGDSALLSLFDSLGVLIASVSLMSESGVDSVDLTSFGTLRSITFDNTASTAAGYAYGDISYDVAAIPLPATLPLLLAAGGALVTLRRRKAV